jgi:hypothetical protein
MGNGTKMKKWRLRVAPLCFVLTGLLCAQTFPWKDFKPRTLKEIIQQNIEAVRASTSTRVFLAKDILPSRVGVTYVGLSRPISAEKQDFIAQWSRSYTADSNYTTLYETELLFVQDGKEYWLPVQKQVSPYLEKELSKGQSVDLYLIRAGGRRAGDQWDWVLLVEEFQKPKPK